jgi:anti-sigma regulatory factor (Ser/Thr protein kinase)
VVTITIRGLRLVGWKRLRADGGFGFQLMRHLMDKVEVAAKPEGTWIMLRHQLR